ncbi:hypothetical protein E4T56_gene16223 [Termitomyces sp. T112]|nr:hypothetical protein E4T56_gene16223 [Termitomyces sp. T112]
MPALTLLRCSYPFASCHTISYPHLTTPVRLETKLWSWYHSVDEELDVMLEMGTETMKFALEEKIRFEQGNSGMSFEWAIHDLRSATANTNDTRRDDQKDSCTINARNQSTITSSIHKSLEINNTLPDVPMTNWGCQLARFWLGTRWRNTVGANQGLSQTKPVGVDPQKPSVASEPRRLRIFSKTRNLQPQRRNRGFQWSNSLLEYPPSHWSSVRSLRISEMITKAVANLPERNFHAGAIASKCVPVCHWRCSGWKSIHSGDCLI